MNALGAPGLDGFPTYFFQKNWTIVGKDVCDFVKEVLQGRVSFEDINTTFITQIPKVFHAKKFEEFWPISLCNVIYKIVAQTLANLLKLILPKIIFPQQSAFVLGCLISDSILIDYEALHTLFTRVKDNRVLWP